MSEHHCDPLVATAPGADPRPEREGIPPPRVDEG